MCALVFSVRNSSFKYRSSGIEHDLNSLVEFWGYECRLLYSTCPTIESYVVIVTINLEPKLRRVAIW